MVTTEILLSAEQEKALSQGEIVRLPAHWEEFTDFLETTDYRIEYCNEEIIIMGLAKFIHEWLVIRLATLLSNLYQNKDYFVLGSNLGIQTYDSPHYHNADVTVTAGSPIFWQNSEAIITNPYLVVEILSDGTNKYDLNEKMESYQKIDSIQQIIYVDSRLKSIKTVTRTLDPKSWILTTYRQPTDEVVIDGFILKLEEVFKNMPILES